MTESPKVTGIKERLARIRGKKLDAATTEAPLGVPVVKDQSNLEKKIKKAAEAKNSGQLTKDQQRIEKLSHKQRRAFGIHGEIKDQQQKDEEYGRSETSDEELRDLLT